LVAGTLALGASCLAHADERAPVKVDTLRSEVLLLGQSQSAKPAGAALWKRRSLNVARMTVELPTDPEPATKDAQANRKTVQGMNALKVMFEGVLFRFAHVEFDDDLEVDLDKAAEGALANLRNTPLVSDLKSRRKDTNLSGVPAVWLEVSYQYEGKPVSYRILIAGKENQLWQASAMYRTADAAQEELARRVLDSVRLQR
jgi:hypothetical protein